MPAAVPKNVNDVVLKVDYLGDACDLVQQQAIKTDNLFNGETWQIGLQRFLGRGKIDLNLKDWNRQTTGIQAELVQEIKSKGTRFKSIKSVPQYQTVVHLN